MRYSGLYVEGVYLAGGEYDCCFPPRQGGSGTAVANWKMLCKLYFGQVYMNMPIMLKNVHGVR